MIKTTRSSAIGRIAARYRRMMRRAGLPVPTDKSIEAVLVAYHSIRPLRITDMARGPMPHLAHDVSGILIGRDFTPRYAVRQ